MKRTYRAEIARPAGIPYRDGELVRNAAIWIKGSGGVKLDKDHRVPTRLFAESGRVYLDIDVGEDCDLASLTLEPFRFAGPFVDLAGKGIETETAER